MLSETYTYVSQLYAHHMRVCQRRVTPIHNSQGLNNLNTLLLGYK